MTALEEYAISGAEQFAAEMRRNGYELTPDEFDGIGMYNMGVCHQVTIRRHNKSCAYRGGTGFFCFGITG